MTQSLMSLNSRSQRVSQPDTEAAAEYFEERAAIMEHDGGLPREEAERLARLETNKIFGRELII